MKRFSENIQNNLSYYVYSYKDPRNNKIFYVGKGKDNRVFSHLKDRTECRKTKLIEDIKNDGLEPIIEILIHGINNETDALKIESVIIDVIGIENLTNDKRGVESREHGKMTIEQVISIYNSEPVEIKLKNVMLIKLTKSYYYGITDIELYDRTRGSWTVGENRNKVKYVFSTYKNIVQEVYEVAGWFQSNTTFLTNEEEPGDRYEFVGRLSNKKIREQYKYKDVSKYFNNTQHPFVYVNME
jgi:hypothetical protein